MIKRILIIFVTILYTQSVFGQSDNNLNRQILILQKNVEDLQRFIYAGKPPQQATGKVNPLPNDLFQNQQNNTSSKFIDENELNARLANIQLQEQEQEDKNRALRGLIEEVSHRISILEEQITRANEDTNLRLQKLEDQLRQQTNPNNRTAANTLQSKQNTDLNNTQNNNGIGNGVLGQIKSNDLNGNGITLPEKQELIDNSSSLTPLDNIDTTSIPPEEKYQQAFTILQQRQYNIAERQFLDFLNQHRDHKLAGNASYWLGETYYAQKNYSKAAATFLDSYQNYPNSNKLNHSLYKLALSLEALGEIDAACTALNEYKEKFAGRDKRISGLSNKKYQNLNCSPA